MLFCNMRIIARRTLRDFVESRAGRRDQPALKAALDAWFDEVRKARWLTLTRPPLPKLQSWIEVAARWNRNGKDGRVTVIHNSW
jgi:hypothetical protein